VVGELGKLVSEAGKLTFTRNRLSSSAAIRGEGAVGPAEVLAVDVDEEGVVEHLPGAGAGGSQHAKVMENFCQRILGGPSVELISPGIEGIHGVELGNAMILSGLRGGAKVSLPMDGDEYHHLRHISI
jgi:hypothetical protein